ncbi:MAG: 16S rRNA (guanine(527)-N(7))-methyltransferase RsmG [Candidatus Margulisiibacteriota bacterium]|nr:16S rRNA (guanine(527)-N(7))-methyltransferase RsmG [Candidatus Margulisiibacteriota bacterium]
MREEQLFDRYLNELIEWNKKFNLTSITDPDEIKIKHFEDSLTVLQAVDLTNQKVVDIGAGAGFPGIPLKIVRPEIDLLLVEATRKKVNFLEHLIKVLGLKKARAVWGRAEDLSRSKEYAGQFDAAVARAVAKLDVLAAYCLPFIRPGGIFVAMKGPDVEAEVKVADKAVRMLGGSLEKVVSLTLKEGEIKRTLVLIRKTS